MRVHALSSEGRIVAEGSGFFINKDGDVVTSRHILDQAERVNIFVEGKIAAIAEHVVAEDPEADLVQLAVSVPREKVYALKLRVRAPRRGEEIMVLLSPVLVSHGSVLRVDSIGSLGSYFEQTAPVSSAATGSPIVDLNGEVIGMVTVIVVAGKQTAVGIPASRIAGLKKTGKTITFDQWQEKKKRERKSTADEWYMEGLRRVWVADYDSALSHLQRAAQNSLTAPKALRLLANCYERLNRPKDQAEAIQQLIRIQPRNLDAYFELANVYGTYGYYHEVVDILNHALSIQSDYYPAYAYMGWAYMHLDSLEKAEAMAKKCITIKPDYDQGHVYLGTIYAATNRFEMATNAFKQALRINPGNTYAHYELSQVYGKKADYSSEIESLEAARKIRPEDRRILLALGRAYLYRLGNAQKAIAALRSAHEANPLNPEVLYELGHALWKIGDKDSALAVHRTLKTLNSDYARHLYTIMSK